MVLEAAVLNVLAGMQDEFEEAMQRARSLIGASKGFHSLELRKCVETPNRYLLLVQWEELEDHTIGFRQSDRYLAWRELLHRFYDPFPLVEHYGENLIHS